MTVTSICVLFAPQWTVPSGGIDGNVTFLARGPSLEAFELAKILAANPAAVFVLNDRDAMTLLVSAIETVDERQSPHRCRGPRQ